MKKTVSFLTVLLLVLSLIFAVGCGEKKQEKSSTESTTKKDEEPKKSFTIKLDANATTGYSWETDISDKKLVKLKDKYEVDPSEKGMVGVGGKQYFTVIPLKKGDVTITCTYVAPGTKAVELVAVYNLSIDEDLYITETSHSGTYFNRPNAVETTRYVVKLPCEKSKGYNWKCNLDKDDLAEFDESFNPKNNMTSEEDADAEGMQIFVISALKSGEIVLKFTYEKEGKAEPVYDAVYRLNIDENLIITEKSKTGSFFEK